MVRLWYRVPDTQTGKTVTFLWYEQKAPTEADMKEVFTAARKFAATEPEAWLEAEKRGTLPNDKKDLLVKARRLGLAPDPKDIGWDAIAWGLYGADEETLAKKQLVERIMKAKGIMIASKSKVKDKSIYIFLPLYAFAVWAMPITVFSLVGIFLAKERLSK